MKQLLGCCLFLLIYVQGFSQIYPTQYRPPGLQWRQLTTPHFNIVFPAGEDTVALRTGRILESQYDSVQALTGGELTNFPVILTNYSDRSNGFVTSLHFRSEIQVSPIKGKTLNPESGNWLEAVAPHELVHAMQFSKTGGFGVGGLLNLFSPDLARSLHGAIPAGINEGIAVQYETGNVAPGGGRGDYPFFYNQFNSIFTSPGRWSMGEMIHFPERSRPFGRHYMGGYEFTSWLHSAYGDSTSRKALNFYIDLPFLGYGVALRHATGKWPNQLYNEFEEHKKNALSSPKLYDVFEPVPIPFRGASVREPRWLNDSTLVFYGSFYNARPGFYRYDLTTGVFERLVTTNSVGDYNYDLSSSGRKLLYAYYQSDTYYDDTFKAELVEADLTNGDTKQLTKKGRMYAPAYAGSTLLSLQTNHTSSSLVEYHPGTGAVEELASLGKQQIIEVAVHPHNPDRLAVVVNKRGMQALWLGSRQSLPADLRDEPLISFSGGSVFDPAWHPGGEKLLFSADFDGTLNIYEYDLSAGTLRRVTGSNYNAFEASYSPDGNRIVFVRQQKNERLPGILDRAHFEGTLIDSELWRPSAAKQSFMRRPELGSPISEEWPVETYREGLSWLVPRAILPVFEEVSNRNVYQAGASLHSSSLLQDRSYSLETTVVQNQPWFDLEYRNTTFYPGFKIRAFRQPSFFTAETDPGPRTFLMERRGASLSIPVQLDLDRNIFNTILRFEPKLSVTALHALNPDGSSASNRVSLPLAGLDASLAYRVQQNIRDLQPNSGIYLVADYDQYLGSGNLFLQGRQQPLLFNNLPYRVRGGIYSYLSPNRRWNQSLRLSLLVTRRSEPVFDNQFPVSNGFSEAVFPQSDNLASFNTRYTIPLYYSDNGGLLVPVYLSNIYLSGFTATVADLDRPGTLKDSRTVLGGGIRFQFRLSNLSFDIGIGMGYEPAREQTNIFIGNF